MPLLALVTAAALLIAPAAAPAAPLAKPKPPSQSQVVYQKEAGPIGFGSVDGTAPYTDALGTKTWEYDQWTGPLHRTGFPATEVIASWTADTPPGSWLQVEMRARNSGGLTKWYVMGRWAYADTDIRRTSVPGQGDEDGNVYVDTFVAKDGLPVSAYQLRLTLYRQNGVTPVVRTLGAMASNVPERETVQASPRGGAWGIELPVPRRSQNIHEGEYPEYDGGGEAWCSPTSTAMVMAYWRAGPTDEELAWVNPAYADKEVDHAARHTYDYDYEGAGNWPFNTAYAGHYGLDGHVTRLRSLTELEKYIKAGIPVITSQSFEAEELPGAGYSTNGHLMVIIGFTRNGDVIANDPASPDNASVRHVYPRANFENVWQTSTGGISYIIAPPGRSK